MLPGGVLAIVLGDRAGGMELGPGIDAVLVLDGFVAQAIWQVKIGMWLAPVLSLASGLACEDRQSLS